MKFRNIRGRFHWALPMISTSKISVFHIFLVSWCATPAHQALVAGVLHKGPHSEVCFVRVLSNSAQKVNAAQGASGVGKITSLPIRTFSNFPPFACSAGCIHTIGTALANYLRNTQFALQPVTPDLGDKGLVCWCAGPRPFSKPNKSNI